MNKELIAEHAYRIEKGIELGLLSLAKSSLFLINLRSSLQPIPEEVKVAYEKYKPLISGVYGNDHLNDIYLYHGTGRYHYQANGEHKYDNFTNDRAIDILQAILTSGLQPQTDIWLPTPARNATVSLTRQRFYARWYADRHNFNSLDWSYGNSFDWAFMYVVKTIGDPMAVPYIILLLREKSKRNLGLLGSAQKWVSDVRNDIQPRTDYSIVWKSKSTIPDNFGIVVGIKASDVNNYDLHLLQRSERRTLQPIPAKNFAFLEAPLRYVDFVKGMATELGRPELIVLPMECVDLHMSKFPLKELTQMDTDNAIRKLLIKNEADVYQLDFTQLDRDDLLLLAADSISEKYSPQRLLDKLADVPILRSLFSQRSSWEGFTIKYHTLCGLMLLEKYFASNDNLPGGISQEFFRIFFSLHDIGDSLGRTTKTKLAYNQAISVEFFTQLKFGQREIATVKALLSDDPIGSYLKKMGVLTELISHLPKSMQFQLNNKTIEAFNKSVTEARIRIKKMSDMAGMNYKDFLKLVSLFHMIDAGSYTSEGGSIGTLNYVFSFDHEQGKMSYSQNILHLIEALAE